MDRLQALGVPVDVLAPDAFRRSNIALQLARLRELQAAQARGQNQPPADESAAAAPVALPPAAAASGTGPR